MSKAIITEQHLHDIADAIIAKGGATAPMTPAQMPDAIQSIPSGGGTSYPVAWKNDGKTHVWIHISPEMMPLNGFNFGRWVFHRETSGNVTIDWGDGTTPYSFSVGDATMIGDVLHRYTEPGDYEVVVSGYDTITDFGSIYLFGWATNFDSPTRSTPRSMQSVVQVEFAKVKATRFALNTLFGMPNCIAYRIDADCEMSSITGINSPNVRIADLTGVNITSIPNNYYLEGANLSEIIIPASVVDIGTQAFRRCRCLTVDFIFNQMTTVVRNAVLAETSILSVDIPSSVTSIEANAFLNVMTMKYVICRAIEPPTLDNVNAFQGFTRNFYVPKGSAEAYKAAVNWSSFASRIFELDEGGNIPA